AFRRSKAPEDSIVLKLRGLDPVAHYRLVSLDGVAVPSGTFSGQQLMEAGAPVRLASPSQAGVVRVERVSG
ncbi:MAG TPA: GH36 C-terminal domain-containing protein, partial [Fimbriimonadaceae bacterium]|nr:GH36 C-terminal domain-containing protein [Fimbriimonadaceae bacterium]